MEDGALSGGDVGRVRMALWQLVHRRADVRSPELLTLRRTTDRLAEIVAYFETREDQRRHQGLQSRAETGQKRDPRVLDHDKTTSCR